MSSKFLERIEEIREGAAPRLGFGTTRPPRLPGLALVVLAQVQDLPRISALNSDAVIVSGPGGSDEMHTWSSDVSDVRWGVWTSYLSSKEAAAWRDAGADPIVIPNMDMELAGIASKDAARVLVLESGVSPEELRDLNSLPVDAVLVSLPGDPSGWTLQDLAGLARVSGRVGKHLLAEVSGAPDGDTLEALRNAGVAGLVIGLSAGEETINDLKESLLNMSRPGADSRSRSAAILPGSVYADRRPAPPEPDPDDD